MAPIVTRTDFGSDLSTFTSEFTAGFQHDLFVLYKGFKDSELLTQAQSLFAEFRAAELHLDDENFDLGAYRSGAELISHEWICAFNSYSVISSEGWLYKLAANLDRPNVGIVGASGSYESLGVVEGRFPDFPNPHIRSNGFMLSRDHLIRFLPQRVPTKFDAFLIESGPESLTHRFFSIGLTALVVGKNGRGYPPHLWPGSNTFRLNAQNNLLIRDNVTEAYARSSPPDRSRIAASTWGGFRDGALRSL